ncbi:MAG: class I tRNA ligase family protein, partial [Candidatus Woesearchaeota archaeon]
FVVISPEHPLLSSEEAIIPKEFRKVVDDYRVYAKKKTKEERMNDKAKKTGVFSGLYCLNQLTNKKMPLWVADFVLMDVGTGVVVGVPGHDLRDFDFAKEFGLEITRVVVGSDGDRAQITGRGQVQEEEGTIVNSEFLDGLDIHSATQRIMDYLEDKGWGRRTVRFRLHDWLISRQRFWGCPIPVVYCDKCGEVPVPIEKLPVRLPENYKFTIGEGNPLVHCEEFINTVCPKCGGNAKRETDTMDTFVDSSWYFLRYCDPHNTALPFDPKKAAYWMPIDQYIGGKEHATMHLIYFRFFTKFFRDIGMLKIDEPTFNLFNQGMLHKGGVVMSKSKGNVVSQDTIAEKYGIDTARFFLMFVASCDKDMEWDDKGVEGSYRFMNKVWKLVTEAKIVTKTIDRQESKLHKTIKEVTESITDFKYNLGLISLMDFVQFLSNQKELSRHVVEGLIVLLSPFTPHICEELWESIGNKPFISLQPWPRYDAKKVNKRFEQEEMLIERVSADIRAVLDLLKIKPNSITVIVSPVWKYKIVEQIKQIMAEKRDVGAIIREVMVADHSKEIAAIVPRIVKNPSIVGDVLSQEIEYNALGEAAERLQNIFGCKINVVRAEESSHSKASQALPSKPAIVVA